MVDLGLKPEIGGIKTIEPDVACDFIPALSPDALLFVESRLIGGQVLEVDSCMVLKKERDLFAFVPSGSVHIEMDSVAVERSEQVLEDREESLAVTVGGAYESLPSQERCHPSGEVESLSVLAGCGDFEALAFPGPASSKTGMEAETGFVLKDDRFIGFELAQFFLTPPENRWRLWLEPEDKHNQPVSDCNPGDATSIGLALPAGVRPSCANESPMWARPSQLAVSQNHGASSPNPAVAAPLLRLSAAPNARAAPWALRPGSRSDSHHVSSAPESHAPSSATHLSFPAAGPPEPAAWPQSSIPPMPPGFASPVQEAAPWLPRDVSQTRLSQRKYSITMQQLLVRSY